MYGSPDCYLNTENDPEDEEEGREEAAEEDGQERTVPPTKEIPRTPEWDNIFDMVSNPVPMGRLHLTNQNVDKLR